MHIYFSGIGGTGIGPLAIIAKQAGFQVSGSDSQPSQYTDYLQKAGIKLHIGQDKDQIVAEHAQDPIDWVVFSSAVLITDPNHPELQFAKENDIKYTKRDECLNMILDQKKLKLIAIAGTHGKTTTTALVIWLFKQLGIAVSYSVGAKISFGPMGEYDPKSEYFVYECDEFDRNFLSFKPEVSIVTIADWDHHDIYPTRDGYKQAFRDFIANSENVYMFSRDFSYLSPPPQDKINVLDDDDQLINKLTLAGLHNRQNTCVAIKAIAAILDEDVEKLVEIANQFPGTSRRFEMIATNIYSDYAHTPEEIAATLQLAYEKSDNVIVVYEPLTNRRQHYMKNLYESIFKSAKQVYWLPSYLAREDPGLPIITPEQLIALLEPGTRAQAAEMDDQLWQTISEHAKDGDLVLCLAGGGGGSLDEWIRKRAASN